MKVKELIKKLQQMPQNMVVVMSGHERGYDNIKVVDSIKVIEDNIDIDNHKQKEAWYYGRYCDASVSSDFGSNKDFLHLKVVRII